MLLHFSFHLYTYNSMQVSLKQNNLPYFTVNYESLTQTPRSKINRRCLHSEISSDFRCRAGAGMLITERPSRRGDDGVRD
jgi:hypothetical protein